MRSFQIQDQNPFMSKMLLGESFDAFQLSEASITTYAAFQIDGSYHPEYFSAAEEETSSPADKIPTEEEKSGYISWHRVRPFFYDLVKGKYTPLRFRIILRVSPQNVENLLKDEAPGVSPDQVSGLFLNIQFDGKILQCTSGVSMRSFSLDRTVENLWDEKAEEFLKKIGISFV